jgi:hypothetical protein
VGDGLQPRSFTYIDDRITGTVKLAKWDVTVSVSVGSSELVTINAMVDLVADIGGIGVTSRHDLRAPQGVRGRNIDNTLILDTVGWEPVTSRRDGSRRLIRTAGAHRSAPTDAAAGAQLRVRGRAIPDGPATVPVRNGASRTAFRAGDPVGVGGLDIGRSR